MQAKLGAMRWRSPFVLAMAGTLAIHLIVVTAVDALVVTHPPRPPVPAPHVELVEVEVPPVVRPLPPPVTPQAAPPVDEAKPAPTPPAPHAAPRQIRTAPAPAPPAPTEPPAPSGGDEVVHMDNIAPAATGVGVAVGKPATGRIARGGAGGGTGAGSGSGAADEARPVSVARTKTFPVVKGDHEFVASKDYPAEARALGIEGAIRVRLVVDERGKVKSQVLLNRLGHGLDELALKRAAEIEFEPAKDTEDHPVTCVVVWTFNMTLPK